MSEDYFEAEVLDRLSNQRSKLDHLDSVMTINRNMQLDLLKEIRATQLRHGEMILHLMRDRDAL